jgi:Transcription factor WhiB
LIVVMDGHGHEQHRRGVTPVADRGDRVGWRDLAACRGIGPAPFYGSVGAAQACCGRCRVDEVCFWFALATEEEAGYRFGIWAGTTPAARAQIATVIGAGYARRRFLALLGTNPADCRPPVWEQF